MRPTLVFIRGHYVDGKLVYCRGDEVPPGLFTRETINRALDEGYLAEHDSAKRQSLYRLFPSFSGLQEEPTQQTKG